LHRITSSIPLFLLLAIPATPQLRARMEQPQGQLDSSESLFAVLASINAAGFDAEIDSASNHPLRKAVREYIASQKPASLEALRRFVRDHHQKDDLSQYISFALAVNGPPDFEYRYPGSALPPDVDALNELPPLLVKFYAEAHLEELWKRVEPAYNQVIEQYHPLVARAVLQVNAYLRNDTAGYLGRRFQIFIDLLGSPNQVQSRGYVDDYFVVVTPSLEPRINEIRHAYLHYLIDPLPLRYSDVLATKRGVGDYALGAPALEPHFKNDYILLATECFIKAVESRIDRKPAEVDQALREGFVMTPAFAEQLATYEQQEQAMRLYFPDLVRGIDLKREEARLDHLDFVSTRSNVSVRTVTKEVPKILTGAEKTLDDAEKLYLARDLKHAQDTYLRVSKETDKMPLHAKAYYGLARIAVLDHDPETGYRLFQKVLELEPDAETKAWSLLYLARLADSQGDRQEAEKQYKAALAVEGAPDSVRKAAEKGLNEAFRKQ
jgi:tetratricopeptide (TPR) repeat protein